MIVSNRSLIQSVTVLSELKRQHTIFAAPASYIETGSVGRALELERNNALLMFIRVHNCILLGSWC